MHLRSLACVTMRALQGARAIGYTVRSLILDFFNLARAGCESAQDFSTLFWLFLYFARAGQNNYQDFSILISRLLISRGGGFPPSVICSAFGDFCPPSAIFSAFGADVPVDGSPPEPKS